MIELQITLSLDELEVLAQGETLSFDQPALNQRITIQADTSAVNAFKQHVHAALLNLLPVNPSKH